MKNTLQDVMKKQGFIRDRVAEQAKLKKQRRLNRKAARANEAFESDEEIDLDEVDQTKILLRQCIDSLNLGIKERNGQYPTTGNIVFTMSQVKEINTLRSILKRVSFSNEQAQDFFWMIGKEWFDISEKYLKWIDGGKREVSMNVILSQLDLFIGLYNDHWSNAASADPFRLNPSKRRKVTTQVVTHGTPLNDQQKQMYVDMMKLNIGAYNQHCATLKKLEVDQQEELQRLYREYKMQAAKVQRQVETPRNTKSFQKWTNEKYKQ